MINKNNFLWFYVLGKKINIASMIFFLDTRMSKQKYMSKTALIIMSIVYFMTTL